MLVLRSTPEGWPYYEFRSHFTSKHHQGGLADNPDESDGKKFDRCPVKTLERFLKHLNPNLHTGSVSTTKRSVNKVPVTKRWSVVLHIREHDEKHVKICILNKSRIPQQWKLGEVTPVFKKDCSFTKCNYRPITILPSLSKVFETLVHTRISPYFEDIFHEHVFAYRKHHGTDTALLSLTEQWRKE